ncbi:MAG: FAD-binding oxidoreductase [Actinomycetes bacterium]
MSVLDRLRDAVGVDHVHVDPDITRPYGTDWTGRWSVTPLAVVRPKSTQQVASAVRACAVDGVPIVPQGGNTGLVGGSVPATSDAVIVSTGRLTTHCPVDRVRRQVTIGAGLAVAQVHALAAESGLMYGVDLASRDSATIGGTVATNAGGVRVVRYGDTRAQVVGVEAVLADGSIVDRTNALPKDSAGYDLSQLLVGSEGTLAIITAVCVRLHDPLPTDRTTALVGVASLREAAALTAGAVAKRDELLAAEYIDDAGMLLVCEVAGLPHPLVGRWPYYLLIETTGTPLLPEDADAAVDRRLWAYRERQSEAAATLGTGHSLDIALASEQLDGFLADLPHLVHPHRVFTFGHLAEGNVHIQVSGPKPRDHGPTEAVLAVVAERGGSISSEHGVGRDKPAYLHLAREAAEIQAMRAIKDAVDPQHLMNPGVLFTTETRSTATMTSS